MTIENSVTKADWKARISCGVCIRGEAVALSVISSMLHLKPTRILEKGRLWPRNRNRRATITEWAWWTTMKESMDLEAEISELFAEIEPSKGCIRTLAEDGMEIIIAVAVYARGGVPAMYLTPKTLRSVVDLNAALDIDCYYDMDDEGSKGHA